MTDTNLTDLKCQNTIWLTPESLLSPVRDYFGGQIPLDPATEPDNPTKAKFYGCEFPQPEAACLGDGLAIRWSLYDGTFVNPPYGRVIRRWCRRIDEEAQQGATIIALLPAGARFSTKYFQDHIFSEALNAACFVRGRVKFARPGGDGTVGNNPYDSVIYGFNVDHDKFVKCFGHLGKVMKIDVISPAD